MEENNNQTPQPAKTGSKYTNLEPNIAGALSYLIPPISGIVFFLWEKEDKYVRFHAFQSILLGVAVYIAYAICTILASVIIGALLMPLVSIASIVAWVYCMWKAYNNVSFELPVIGPIATKQINK